MCRACWFSVPRELRCEVTRKWRAVNKDGNALADTWPAYCEARAAAVESTRP